MKTRNRGRARLAAAAWLLALGIGCPREGLDAGEPLALEGGRGEAVGAGHSAQTEGEARCYAGQVFVEEEHRFAPPPPGCERTPSIRWEGRAHWTLREEPPRETGWLLPRSELHTVRVAWEIGQTGFEEHCVEPDPAPDLTGRRTIRRGRVVEPASREGLHLPEAPAHAGALYHEPPPGWSPSGRPLPEARVAPDRLQAGQYELVLPVPCRTFDAPGTRYDGGTTLPAPHGVRCDFGLPIWIAFRPGQSGREDDRTCADEPRFVDGEGGLRGEHRCQIEDRDGRASQLSARWDLRPVPCDDADSTQARAGDAAETRTPTVSEAAGEREEASP